MRKRRKYGFHSLEIKAAQGEATRLWEQAQEADNCNDKEAAFQYRQRAMEYEQRARYWEEKDEWKTNVFLTAIAGFLALWFGYCDGKADGYDEGYSAGYRDGQRVERTR